MRPVADVFYWPLGGALLLMLAGMAARALSGAVAAWPRGGLARAG
jgi:hypothetical protein